MPSATQSEYIRYQNKSPLLRRWIATILLKADLESHLTFGRLDQAIISGFDTTTLTKDNCDDASFIRSWLASELKRCGKGSIDEADVFAINTKLIAKSMGLSKIELAVFRFACLVNGYRPLQATNDLASDSFTEADVCDLLSDLLSLPFDSIYLALQPTSLLRQSGLVQADCGWTGGQNLNRWLSVPGMLSREIFRAQEDDRLLTRAFYWLGPKSTLDRQDFPQSSELSLLKKYFRASLRDRVVGANVLLWGPPGTGKTEMARHIAQSLRKRSIEIATINIDRRELSATDRLDCYRFCQAIMARSKNAIVTFDEVEDVLSDGSYSRWGFRSAGKFSKSMINAILESNQTPAIWITNTVDGVDPAYLRRFDYVLNLKSPEASVKKRIAMKTLKNLPLNKGFIDRLAQHDAITPALIQKAGKICERVGVATSGEATQTARQILNGDLKALSKQPLVSNRKVVKKRVALPYRPNLINCDTDIEQLAKSLRPGSSVRIVSFGPPGTGKTAWASHLAKKVGRPLLVKHASDILDKFVGGTEANIARAFEEAKSTRSVLLLDEMDSFLPNRASADRHWEVTQTNQFLTAMEEFEGILVCSTNLLGNLDPAAMRRFDFKINFDFLRPKQACEVAHDLLGVLQAPVSRKCRRHLNKALAGTKLTHGDFALLLRRYSAMKAKPNWEQLVSDLNSEESFRDTEKSRPIGFLANV